MTARPLSQDHRAAAAVFVLCFAATLLLSATWPAPQTSRAEAVRTHIPLLPHSQGDAHYTQGPYLERQYRLTHDVPVRLTGCRGGGPVGQQATRKRSTGDGGVSQARSAACQPMMLVGCMSSATLHLDRCAVHIATT